MVLFLDGALAMTCVVAGLFFLRFWLTTRDRLFLWFAAGFWALAGHWTAVGLLNMPSESRYYLYLARLLAFVLFLLGIIDKNRRRS